MLEKLIELLGKSLETQEIKDLYLSFNAKFPKTITCTANKDRIKGKVENDGINLSFTRGGNSKYLKPILGKKKGSYIGMFTMIEFTKKYNAALPYGVRYNMSEAELTKVLGVSKEINFMGKTITWRKKLNDKHELIVSDVQATASSLEVIRGVTIQFIWEADLYTMEEYEKVGL